MPTLRKPATEITRFEVRERDVRLESIERRGDNLLTCWFASDELEDFKVLGDDHIKFQVPDAEGKLAQSRRDPETTRLLNPGELGLRTMTPRNVDAEAGRVRIDMVEHEHGHLAEWLKRAQPGDVCRFYGPRGSKKIVEPLDRVVFIVDTSALPGAEGRLKELGVPGDLHLVNTPGVEVELPADVTLHRHELPADDWSTLVAQVVAELPAEGNVWLWAAGEAHGVAQVRKAAKAVVREGFFAQFNGYWEAGVSEYDHHAELPAV